MPQIKSSTGALIKAIKSLIVTELSLSPSKVLLVARSEIPNFTGDQDIIIRPGSPTPDDGFIQGSGRTASVVSRQIYIAIRTRFAVDISNSDERWLLDPTYGHLAREEQLINLLHLRWIKDASNNDLLIQPLRMTKPVTDFVGHSQEGYTRGSNEKDSQKQYGISLLAFEAAYMLGVTSNGY